VRKLTTFYQAEGGSPAPIGICQKLSASSDRKVRALVMFVAVAQHHAEATPMAWRLLCRAGSA